MIENLKIKVANYDLIEIGLTSWQIRDEQNQ